VAASIAALGGCASGPPAFSTMPPESLFDYAVERIRADELEDASAALERFVFQFPTHPRYQEARFRLGQAYFAREMYISAVAEFARLATEFAAGAYADDARFGVCESYYALSPKPQLDQQYTHAAIDHCESLIAYYADSPHVERAREMVTELRDKLAMKIYQAALLYRRLDAIDSAILYFENVVELYPATAVAPMALLQLYEAYTELNYTDEAEQAKSRLLEQFPDSAEARRLRGGAAGSDS